MAKMNIRKEVENLKENGFKGFTEYVEKNWELYEKRGSRAIKTAYGRDNVEKRIDKLKKK